MSWSMLALLGRGAAGTDWLEDDFFIFSLAELWQQYTHVYQQSEWMRWS